MATQQKAVATATAAATERSTVLGIVSPHLPKRVLPKGEVDTRPTVVDLSPSYVDLYATASGEPFLRFLNLQGVSPWWPIFVRGKPNPLVVTMIKGDLMMSDLDDSKDSVEAAIQMLAREAIKRKHFKVSDDTILAALALVFEQVAIEESVRMTTRQIEQHCIIVGKREGFDVEAWAKYNAFSDAIVMRIPQLLQLGIRVVDQDRTEIGRTFTIELTEANRARQIRLTQQLSQASSAADEADEADEMLRRVPAALRESLQAREPGLYILSGQPDVTARYLDVLTHLVVCENPKDGRPCGNCITCQLYHYADDRKGERPIYEEAIPTLYLDGPKVDDDRVALERSKYTATERVLIVVERYEELDEDARTAIDEWIVDDTRNIWMVAIEGARTVTETVAGHVKSLHVC